MLVPRFAVLFVTMCALVLGCSKKAAPNPSSQAGPSTVKLKLALNWVPEPEFGGFYEARERGSYRKRDLDVEVMGGGAGVPVVQMVAIMQHGPPSAFDWRGTRFIGSECCFSAYLTGHGALVMLLPGGLGFGSSCQILAQVTMWDGALGLPG